jgi:hypothetical protein
MLPCTPRIAEVDVLISFLLFGFSSCRQARSKCASMRQLSCISHNASSVKSADPNMPSSYLLCGKSGGADPPPCIGCIGYWIYIHFSDHCQNLTGVVVHVFVTEYFCYLSIPGVPQIFSIQEVSSTIIP